MNDEDAVAKAGEQIAGVIKLITEKKKPVEGVVTLLKELLAIAEAGDIRSLAYVMVPTDQSMSPGHGYTYDVREDWYGLSAAVSHLGYRLNSIVDE